MLYLKKLKRYYINILMQLSEAADKESIVKYEIMLLAMVLAPMIIIAAFINIYVGFLWKLSYLEIILFFIILNISAIASILSANSSFSNRFKINAISLAYMIALIATFLIYFERLELLFFFILMIIASFAILCNDKTMLNYLVFTYLQTYILVIIVYRPIGNPENFSFDISLLCLIVFLIVSSYLSNYLYRLVITKKISEYFKIKIKNDEILRLNKRLVESESQLIHKNIKLNEYNQKVRANKKELEYLAYKDSLTGLPNRKMLIEKLYAVIKENSDDRQLFAIAFIDLDNFKKVNDSLGHSAGDTLLQLAADRLMGEIHKDDFLGRLGGDELALIINRPLNRKNLFFYVQSLCSLINAPFNINENYMKVTASIGIALWPNDAVEANDLLKAADTAMYKAKETGKNNVQFYHRDMERAILRKLEMENSLIEALQNNEFFLEYQPIFEAGSKKVSVFEALIRWESKNQGRMSPADFIPLAEEQGLITEIGEWVIRQACRKVREVSEKFNREIKIAVNVSPLQMKKDNFISRFKEILKSEKTVPESIEIEITESLFIEDKEKAVKKIMDLRDMGIRIAMDDFGTGFSSLSYLLNLSIDKLKIDKSFIDKINKEPKKTELVGAIIKMAHLLDIEVVAEGVENKEQLDYLIKEKCDLIQGYYLSRPLAEEQMNDFLSDLEADEINDKN